MVIKHVFSFDAPPEKMSSFVGWCGETSKPFFEDCSEVKSSCLNSYINERYVARARQLKTARGGVSVAGGWNLRLIHGAKISRKTPLFSDKREKLAKADKKKMTWLPCYFWLRIWGLARALKKAGIISQPEMIRVYVSP